MQHLVAVQVQAGKRFEATATKQSPWHAFGHDRQPGHRSPAMQMSQQVLSSQPPNSPVPRIGRACGRNATDGANPPQQTKKMAAQQQQVEGNSGVDASSTAKSAVPTASCKPSNTTCTNGRGPLTPSSCMTVWRCRAHQTCFALSTPLPLDLDASF